MPLAGQLVCSPSRYLGYLCVLDKVLLETWRQRGIHRTNATNGLLTTGRAGCLGVVSALVTDRSGPTGGGRIGDVTLAAPTDSLLTDGGAFGARAGRRRSWACSQKCRQLPPRSPQSAPAAMDTLVFTIVVHRRRLCSSVV